MLSVTATQLRKDLFHCLERLALGETIAILWHGEEVGRLVPKESKQWRTRLKNKARLAVPEDQAFTPLDDLWKDYV